MDHRHPRNILVQMLWVMGKCLQDECDRLRCNKNDCPMFHLIHEMDSSLTLLISYLPQGVEKKEFK